MPGWSSPLLPSAAGDGVMRAWAPNAGSFVGVPPEGGEEVGWEVLPPKAAVAEAPVWSADPNAWPFAAPADAGSNGGGGGGGNGGGSLCGVGGGGIIGVGGGGDNGSGAGAGLGVPAESLLPAWPYLVLAPGPAI